MGLFPHVQREHAGHGLTTVTVQCEHINCELWHSIITDLLVAYELELNINNICPA